MIKVLKSGFFTTIQDSGRFGFRDMGVPVSGVMDHKACEKANFLLENEENAAVLEITMTGPTLSFDENTYIALAGAGLTATLNNRPIENYKVYKIAKGDILSYGKLVNGFRGYLAVKGGLRTEMTMGSRSQFFPVTAERRVLDNDELPYEPTSTFEPKISEIRVDRYLNSNELIVFKGPEFECLTDYSLAQLFSREFSVAKENNRMGYQISESLDACKHSMLTSATVPGTVQITPAGKLIVLMKDGQTTGGYPRLLQLNQESISVLAQKKFGDTVRFKLFN